MYEQNDVMLIRNDIQRIIGSQVRLETTKGRQKAVIRRGVITHAYPSVFTILVNEAPAPSRKLSFSYTDVLTNAIEITLCE